MPSTKYAVLRDGPFGKRYYSIIYAIEAEDIALIKFGRTNNVEKRFKSLVGASPNRLILLGSMWMPDGTEAYIHQHLQSHRSHGEWFYAEEPCRAIAKMLADGLHHELAQEIELGWIIKDSDLKRESA